MDNDLVFSSTVNAEENNNNLLEFLAHRFPYHTREEWEKHITESRITINGEVVSDKDNVISAGDTLSYTPDSLMEPAVPLDVEMIGSSADFLITGKPAGVPVMRTGTIIRNTFINLVRRKCNNPDIHLMHRLDRETSGVVLCAKSRAVCKKYHKDLRQILIGKYYLAIVRGKLEIENLSINLPLGPDHESPIRCEVAINTNGKPSQTIISTVASSHNKSLILVKLVTGRRHQIRCHLAHLGHPVIGDKIYAHNGKYYLKRLTQELNREDYFILDAENHTLHAWAADIKFPGQDGKLYYSECFSADFLQHIEVFHNWQVLATEKLYEMRHPKNT